MTASYRAVLCVNYLSNAKIRDQNMSGGFLEEFARANVRFLYFQKNDSERRFIFLSFKITSEKHLFSLGK